MFDFQKLAVYRKSKLFHKFCKNVVKENRIEYPECNQLLRASLSVMLNIAEGAGRYSKLDKRRFYIIARGSIYECVAVFDSLEDQRLVKNAVYNQFYGLAEELSKMLYALIRNLS